MQFLIELGTGEGKDEWSFLLRRVDLVDVYKYVEEKQKGKRGGVGAWGCGGPGLLKYLKGRWSLPARVAPQKN